MMPYGFDLIFILPSAHYLEIASSNILVLNMPLNARDIVDSVQMLAGSANLSKKISYNSRTRNEKIVIEKAKAYLMDTYGISEPAAHKLLQKRSMQDGIPIVRIAQTILDDGFNYKE
ncbi:hypothetical protein SDC9_168625 [bioreactor metagenome]|uniref:ANTAR domain-containing protein n=1 Tax=bioreactor metagenome TaxID=1076179 RepID=A0A645G537_9ZZZZ